MTPVPMISELDPPGRLQSLLSAALGLTVQLASRRSCKGVTVTVLGGKVDAAWVCSYPHVSRIATCSRSWPSRLGAGRHFTAPV
jgi:phosphonate transport system substrate-binding protein